MGIESNTLLEYGAKRVRLAKNEVIFHEGDTAYSFFQVLEGEIHMANYNEGGKMHLQGVFGAGESFGEPPLFGGFVYPAGAFAAKPSEVLRLGKPEFLQLLEELPAVHLLVTRILAKRLFFKAKLASEISMNPPEKRILGLLRHLKQEVHQVSEPFGYEVKLTRQEMADLTGLRVETVIRAVKSLERAGNLQIRQRKVWI